MYRYSAFALNIESELEFPDLPPATAEPDVTIRIGPVARPDRKSTNDDEYGFNYLAGSFHLCQGRSITFQPLPGIDPGVLRVLLMGRVMAFLLRQRGWLPLHGSAVSVGGDGVIFLGNQGAGKSTTAAAFHSRGHAVITDDVAAVRLKDGRCLIRPGGSQLRLLEDSREMFAPSAPGAEPQGDKIRLDLHREPLPDSFEIKRIYVLEYGGALSTAPIPATAAVAALSIHSFVKRPRLNADVLKLHIRDCAAIAAAMRIERLIRPRSMSALPDVIRLVEDDLAAGRRSNQPSI